jgi:hypothetical protein
MRGQEGNVPNFWITAETGVRPALPVQPPLLVLAPAFSHFLDIMALACILYYKVQLTNESSSTSFHRDDLPCLFV